MSCKSDCNKEYGRVNPNKAKSVIKRLIRGNSNYKKGKFYCIQQNAQPARSQQPFAAVLSCSDSRVIPERIFDTGPGKLFVARVAGNVVNSDVSASFEFALKPLGTRVVIVMGHSGCGAVKAAFPDSHIGKPDSTSQYVPSHCLTKLVENIQDAVNPDYDPETVIKQNVIGQARKLLHDGCIAKTKKPYTVLGAFYNKRKKTVFFAKIGKVRFKGGEKEIKEVIDPKWNKNPYKKAKC